MEETGTIDFVQVIIAGMFLIFLFAAVIIVFVMIYQRKMVVEKLKNQALILNQERALLHNSFRIQEQERQTFAANLHDELGAQLSLTKMTVSSLEFTATPVETIENTMQLLNEMADTIRGISYNLMPPTLEQFGLNIAIGEFLKKIEATNFEFKYEESGSAELGGEVKLQLFRIMQEAVNNALKHSQGTIIAVSLIRTNKGAFLTIKDNGCGFEENKINGLGIMNMQRRAQMITYQCNLMSEATGTILTIKPLKQKND